MIEEEFYTNAEIFKLKRKWQIALRRYVLEKAPCSAYARYFGLPIELFREWIEVQFDETSTWGNFSENWQFDHIIPVAYFNFKNKKDLELCWNFMNIRVEKVNMNRNRCNRIDTIAAKAYFIDLLKNTGYPLCEEMIRKIESIEVSQIASNNNVECFIKNHLDTLKAMTHFTEVDFERVNLGMPVSDIIAEREMFDKFGK